MDSFYNDDELKEIGLKSIGQNVLVSRKCSLYGCGGISLDSNVRIDDFCILSGRITIGNYVHIAAGTYLYGGDAGIVIEDYSTLSSRCAVYALTDDYSGNSMTNPMVSERYRDVFSSQVKIESYVIIGTGCTILPGIHIGEGCAVGAMSFVNKNLESWTMYKGIPATAYKKRMKKMMYNHDSESGGYCLSKAHYCSNLKSLLRKGRAA